MIFSSIIGYRHKTSNLSVLIFISENPPHLFHSLEWTLMTTTYIRVKTIRSTRPPSTLVVTTVEPKVHVACNTSPIVSRHVEIVANSHNPIHPNHSDDKKTSEETPLASIRTYEEAPRNKRKKTGFIFFLFQLF